MLATVLKRRLRRLGSLALALALAACGRDSGRTVAPRPAAPGVTADSPVNAVRLLQWSWEHRDLDRYDILLTEDFLFACAATDSAGRPFQGGVFQRPDELEIARHLFVDGNQLAPRANSISLTLDENLIPEPDWRPGRDSEHYRLVTSSIVLRIDTDEEDFEITGTAHFFLVRGDAALFPQELRNRGVLDPNHWYVQRIEDETIQSNRPQLRAMPARRPTWCSVKALYR